MPGALRRCIIRCLYGLCARVVVLFPAVVIAAQCQSDNASETAAAGECLAKLASVARAIAFARSKYPAQSEEEDAPGLDEAAQIVQQLGETAGVAIVAAAVSGTEQLQLPKRVHRSLRAAQERLKKCSPSLEAWAASHDPCGSSVMQALRREFFIDSKAELSDLLSLKWALGRDAPGGASHAIEVPLRGLVRRGVSMAVRRTGGRSFVAKTSREVKRHDDAADNDDDSDDDEAEEDDEADFASSRAAAGRRGISVVRRTDQFSSAAHGLARPASFTPAAVGDTPGSDDLGLDGNDMFADGIEGISTGGADGGKKRGRSVAFAATATAAGGGRILERPAKRPRGGARSADTNADAERISVSVGLLDSGIVLGAVEVIAASML